MQPCIDALKANISTFIDTLTTKGANNDSPVKHWRAKAVGYRDFIADREPFLDAPFVEDPIQLKAQLGALRADGGGDEPESLLDALHRVATMPATMKEATPEPDKWRYRSEAARVVVAFTDASYHPTMQEPRGGTVGDVINALHSNRIILNLFAPDMPCHDELSKADKSDYLPIATDGRSPVEALEEFTRDQANFRKTLEALAKSVSASANTPLL
jgi:hypothetical protein